MAGEVDLGGHGGREGVGGASEGCGERRGAGAGLVGGGGRRRCRAGGRGQRRRDGGGGAGGGSRRGRGRAEEAGAGPAGPSIEFNEEEKDGRERKK